MNKTLKNTSMILPVLASLLTFSLASPSDARAQTQSPLQLTIDECDTASYPVITCTVLPTEGSGVPSRGLQAGAFEAYIDDSLKATDVKIEEFDAKDVRTDTMLLVDFGMTQGGKAIDSLRQVTRKIVENARDTDNIGFIAVMGAIELGDTLNPPLNEKQESDFKSVLEGRNYIINMVNSLDPKPKTPLYDALCKALILTAKRKVGARAVVVLSDGNDKKASTSCEADDPIVRANKDRVPVFAVAVGNDLNAGYMSRLAIQTNGVYLVAGDFDQGAVRYEEVQQILRRRYRVTFTSPLKPDGASHKINIRLNLPAGKADDAVSFNAVASYPLLESLAMEDQRLKDGSLIVLPNNDVTVQPLFVGQPVSLVEFDLETPDGVLTYKATSEPWTYTFSEKNLQGVDRATLTIRAYGADVNDVGTFSFQVQPASVKIDSSSTDGVNSTNTQSSATSDPNKNPSQPASNQTLLQRLLTAPLIYVVIGLGLAIVGVVVFFVVTSMRNRSSAQNQPPFADPIFGPPTEITTIRSDGAIQTTNAMRGNLDDPQLDPPATIIENVEDSGKTVVFGGEEGGKTMVYSPPIARLKITNGSKAATIYDLGSAVSRNVTIGRDVDEKIAGNICLPSKFVSRLHAKISLIDDVLYLTDERSASGTKVDGVPLREGDRIALKPGMIIHFGDITAVVEAP